MDLLNEGLSFLLIGERQASSAVFQFECVKEGPVLVVGKVVVDLLVPDDASPGGLKLRWHISSLLHWNNSKIRELRLQSRTHRYIHDLKPERAPDQVIGQDSGALDACVCPFVGVRVGNIESRNSYGMDLVRRLRDISLDSFFVGITQDRRHDGLGGQEAIVSESEKEDRAPRIRLSEVTGTHCRERACTCSKAEDPSALVFGHGGMIADRWEIGRQ